MRLPHKGRALTITSFAAVGVLVAGGIAWATIPDSDGIIHGCYAKKGGNLKIIDADKVKACPTGYVPLTWNQTGPRGLPGEDGSNGTNGTNGSNGSNGSNGTNGTDGVDGVDGQSPVEIATWNFSHTNDGRPGGVVLATQQRIAEGDKVMGVDATLTGMEGCYFGSVQVGMPDRKDPGINSGVLAQWAIVDGAIYTSDADALVGTEWVQGPDITVPWPGLRAVLSCQDADRNLVAIPDVAGSVTFKWTYVPPQVEIQ